MEGAVVDISIIQIRKILKETNSKDGQEIVDEML